MDKVGCKKCRAFILPVTAQRTGGLCMPCFTGTRDDIEESKAYYKRERELDRTDPARLFWQSLVGRINHPLKGFDTLTEAEKKYFAGDRLLFDVYNGGFEQYFHNSSSDHFYLALQVLNELEAHRVSSTLLRAKEVVFSEHDVPLSVPVRRKYLRRHPITDEQSASLSALDDEFYSNYNWLYDELELYGRREGLFENAA